MNSYGDLLKATDNAVDLTTSLCKKYNIPVENIVQHNKWNGKNCPQMIRAGKPYDWSTFLSKVLTALSSSQQTSTPTPAPTPTPAAKKTNEEVAREVINGSWGNGQARKDELTKAGYDYDDVQSIVNNLLSGGSSGSSSSSSASTAAPTKKSIDEIAKEVINGKWGNGQVRKDKLKAAGYDPAEVQKRVNQLV